jgi:uncharacterized protein
MPVAPTYPGVYIEEIPSGVHTITGVSTSVTAFIGYTARGVVDEPVHIFSFADFERAFGGLSIDSPLSYCVKHFFQNGGTEAYVVRVAQGAAAASVTLRNANTPVLVVSAASAGVWGNNLQIDVDYDTVNPANLFNLRIVEFVERNGEMVPGTTEVYRNLTLNSGDPGFVVAAVNSASQLISVALATGLNISGQGTSTSGPLTAADLARVDASHNRLAFRVNGQGPFEIALAVPPQVDANNPLTTVLDGIAGDMARKMNAVAGGGSVAVTRNGTRLVVTSSNQTDRSSVQLLNASGSSATSILRLGLASGGAEVDGAAAFSPQQTGTVGTLALASSTSGVVDLTNFGANANRLGVSLNGGAPFEIALETPNNPTIDGVAEDIAAKINAVAGATVVGGTVAGGQNIVITSVDPTRCWTIHFTDAATENADALLMGTGAAGAVESPPASSSISNDLPDPVVDAMLPTGNNNPPLRQQHLNVSVNGQAPFDVSLAGVATAGTTPAEKRQNIANAIAAAINARLDPTAVSGSVVGQTIAIRSADAARWSSIHITSAAANDAAAQLRLGLANGGTEDTLTIEVRNGANAASLRTITIPLWAFWGSPKPTAMPRSMDEAVADIDQALKALANAEPYLVGASAQRIGATIRILPGTAAPNDSNTVFVVSAAPALGLTNAPAPNVARYAPGAGVTAFAQVAGTTGNDGTAPTETELRGSELGKTGLYALEDVDLFNLLVMPDATAAAGMMGVLTEAIAYCTRRRAFMIIDAPERVATFAQAQAWIGGAASPLRSRNDALYFPRLREPDPLMNGVVRTFPAAGALAGIYARTDAERGVWKAPAGTAATIVGATGLAYTLTDGENGTLNPRGLNCLRTFPVIGTVSWGARTGNGADALADEYKYVPVRRLALFLEESLYRGTQWVVFEPNDEPLWAQIRLNLGAFMHTLYAQGAFQGQTPRDAYFVKCDKETTTQNDIDLGRVNIVVGFAPLKPAEFVIIQIQQIAGAIKT